MKERKFAERLLESLMETFDEAFVLHSRGRSEQALLITHDIYAAASDFPEPIIKAHRCAIKSAVEAVDKGWLFSAAHRELERRMRIKVEEMLHERGT
jgi:hypothetical protein